MMRKQMVKGSSVNSNNYVDTYNRQGFAIIKFYNEQEYGILDRLAKGWIYRLLSEWTKGKEESLLLDKYHIWSKTEGVKHEQSFAAKNRYLYPDAELEKILINDKIKNFLRDIGMANYKLWDDGWGWLGFRFIRPGAGDGYPFSCKDWGMAKGAVSVWLPIIGFSPKETLNLVPCSHLKEYKRYLPANNKFAKSEYRLLNNDDARDVFNPQLNKGEAIIYHQRMLHSEDVRDSNITRLNLEFRFVLV